MAANGRRHRSTAEVRARARSAFWYAVNAIWITLLLALGLPVLLGALTSSDRAGQAPAQEAPASNPSVPR